MLLQSAKAIAAGIAVSGVSVAYLGHLDIELVLLSLLLLALIALVVTFSFGLPPFMNKTEAEVYLDELRKSYELHGGRDMTRAEYEAWWALWCRENHNKDTKKKD